MKLLFVPQISVDCTADPHTISISNYDDAFNLILKVLKSDLVQAVESVELTYSTPKGDECFSSDCYSTWPGVDGKRKQALSDYAKKYKTYGLYFIDDFEGPKDHHLPPGLSGVEAAIAVIKERLKRNKKPKTLHINVVWAFAGDASCSDHIELDFNDNTIDFSNQDWWIRKSGYKRHLRRLSKLCNTHFEPSSSKD